MFKRLRWFGCLLLLLFITASTAYAQTAASATLSPPDTSDFPQVTVFMDVHNSQGFFVHGIQAEQVRLLEDDQPVELAEFNELRPGVQVVFALNPGASFAIRNSQGISRYDFVLEALIRWAQAREGTTLDDMSVINSSGPSVSHISSASELLPVIQVPTQDLRALNPSLDSLSQAVDLAADMPPRRGMEKAVLLITSPLNGDISLSMQDILSRTLQQHVRIFIWLVASSSDLSTPAADQLRSLAELTGGQFFAFSGTETLPSPEDYLVSLRDIYQLVYRSDIRTGGQHTLIAQVDRDGEHMETLAVNFELNLSPPDPAFLSPEVEILRSLPSGDRKNLLRAADPAALRPLQKNLQVLVDFPDGRTRPLVSSRLYVDGLLAQENTEPPFGEFTWDLTTYTTTAQHVLQVEVLDSLGITGKSIEMPVEVKVDLPTVNPWASLMQNSPVVVGLAGILAAALLALVLIMAGRIGPQAVQLSYRLRRKSRPRPDPLIQSDAPRDEAGGRGERGSRLSGWVNRIHWPQRRLVPTADAFLMPVSNGDDAAPGVPISLTAEEITFGRDKNHATLIIDDPSVDSLHARLIRCEDGEYRLSDQGSVAGTWINYIAVSRDGACLEHGDLIHIGRVSFRFQQRQPQHIRRPKVILERPRS